MRGERLSAVLSLTLATLAAALFVPFAAAQTETVLHSFQNNGKDGMYPLAGVIRDASGNLYGTTYFGGKVGNICGSSTTCGAVFELTPGAAGKWSEKIIYNFNGGSVGDGSFPSAGLIFDSAGNLYGTTATGGRGEWGGQSGTVFELARGTNGGWGEKILHSFRLNGTDGQAPAAPLVFDAVGNLYGTTMDGGVGYLCQGTGTCSGTVLEFTPRTTGGWSETLVYDFDHLPNSTDGLSPLSVTLDGAGNLYGATWKGGTGTNCYGVQDAPYCGTVFEVSPQSGGGWSETILHEFTNDGTDGYSPAGGLIRDSNGNLYGATEGGGSGSCLTSAGLTGCGTVLELMFNGNGGWMEKILHTFQNDGVDGHNPTGSLVFDASGNLYGTTTSGGNPNHCSGDGNLTGCGTVFKLAPQTDGSWTETILYRFRKTPDGNFPAAGLIINGAGNLYGTTSSGGTGACMVGGAKVGCGTVFEITP